MGLIFINGAYVPDGKASVEPRPKTILDPDASVETTNLINGAYYFPGETSTAQLDTTSDNDVPQNRRIGTKKPLFGGGDLSENRTLSLPKASANADGYIAKEDWLTFVNPLATTSPLVATNKIISIPKADTNTDGYLSKEDWTIFDANEPAFADVAIYKTSGETKSYFAASDDDADRGDALLEAMVDVEVGDVVQLGIGTFDIGTSTIDLDSATLRGMGSMRTTINCTNAVASRTNLQLNGTNPVVEDLLFQNLETVLVYLVGQVSAAVTNAVLKRVTISKAGLGGACLSFLSTTSPSTCYCENCSLLSEQINFTVGGSSNNNLIFRNCDFISTPASGDSAYNALIYNDTDLTFYNCRFVATTTGSPSDTICFSTTGPSPINAYFQNCDFDPTAPAGNIIDINNAGAGAITVVGGKGSGTDGKTTYTNAGGGSVTFITSGLEDITP